MGSTYHGLDFRLPTMSTTTEPRITTFYGKRGNSMAIVVELLNGDTAFSWTGVAARCHIRAAGSGDLIVQPTANVTDLGGGKGQLLVAILPEQTAVLPDESFGDVELKRTSPTFGPVNSPTFRLAIEEPFTRG